MQSVMKTCLVATMIFSMTTVALAQGGRGQGRGLGRGGGAHGGGGHGHDDRHEEDRQVFQFLLTNHEKITREVTELTDGVQTLTESRDPEIADKIKEHVQWMEYRIKETHPIRMRDPLFAELFQHTDKIKMQHEDTEHGVRVTETSDDPYVAKLIKAHAKAVSGFVARGFAEAMKNHPVPKRDAPPNQVAKTASAAPAIASYGKVVQLAGATQQPRSGAKICVDLTSAGDPKKLNPALDKVARFVNIYRAAGKEPADVQIAVVLHGDATLSALNADAYAEHFGTDENPNFDCLHQLHEAGVEIYVCGQSLLGKGGKPEDLMVFADTAVSALSAIVNLQADGYAYVPLGK